MTMYAGDLTNTLRKAHRNLTQARILDAALAIIRREEAEALTFARLAEEANVTERTIYRHFPTREALQTAVLLEINKLVAGTATADSKDELIAQPRALFPRIDGQERRMRMFLLSRQGLEGPSAGKRQRLAAVCKVVREARPDLDEAAQLRIGAAIQALNSAYGWMMMTQFAGLTGEEAGQAASEAIAVLLAPPAKAG